MNEQRLGGKTGLLNPYEMMRGIGGLRSYTSRLPAPPSSVNYGYSKKITSWNMALNATFGDCTIAGIEHYFMCQAVVVGTSFPYPGDPITKSTYFGLTGGQDTGLALGTVVSAGAQQGLFGHKIVGAGAINPRDFTTLKQAIAIYGATYVGVLLPENAQQQFSTGSWTLAPGHNPGIDGHCIILAGYDSQWIYGVSWGQVIRISWPWWKTYGTQALALITDWIKNAGHGPTLPYSLMESDLNVLAQA